MKNPPKAVELALRAFGDEGQLFVIAHGLLGSSRNWQAHGKALGRDHRVLTVDMRNHGQSPWVDAMNYGAMAEDLRQVIEGNSTEPALLMGHSMGGKAAMACALQYPDLVKKLIVVDIAPVTYAHNFNDYIDAMLAIEFAQTPRRADLDNALKTTIDNPAIRAFLIQNADLNAADGPRWRPNLERLRETMDALTDWPADLNAKRYEGPAMFIRGALSDYIDDDGIDLIARKFPNAKHVAIPGATHWVHADSPKPFYEALSSFVSQID